ncbi:hypothetical protein ASZ90_018605 [hydrocarbon metagenome]|uniref:NGG1p interacting factor NIF3 n=1 Tax=hydrocarbon metagenome TaxID=938273 RepID=A0A0W8E5R8_9ZZZZ
MKIKDIYQLAVEMGKTFDPRGDEVNRLLEERQKEYDRMNDDEKAFYDEENLTNPYNDTRLLFGEGEQVVKSAICGIDMETPEILLVDLLREKGRRIDMIISHHPEGSARADLHNVMHVQSDMMEGAGVPINIAEGLMEDRISEVKRGLMPINHQRAVDAARLLNIPFMCVHSPADNLVSHYLEKIFAQTPYRTVQDVIDILMGVPEYQQAKRFKAGPAIVSGDKKRRAGKIFLKMTGGTAGSVKSYEKLAAAGVGTIIGMHMTDNHRKAARDNHINVVIAGHMASDSLGINFFLDELEKKGMEIIPAAGLIRVKRDGWNTLRVSR